MIDVSVIIFILSLLGITWMFVSQAKKLKRGVVSEDAFSSKDLSYENLKIINDKIKMMWLRFIHVVAIVISKSWARLTHHTVSWFHKGIRRVENQLIKHEKKNGGDGIGQKSVFLTTIKAYKSEIKKLKGKVEEELPRPRVAEESTPSVDNMTDMNTIDESKLPE